MRSLSDEVVYRLIAQDPAIKKHGMKRALYEALYEKEDVACEGCNGAHCLVGDCDEDEGPLTKAAILQGIKEGLSLPSIIPDAYKLDTDESGFLRLHVFEVVDTNPISDAKLPLLLEMWWSLDSHSIVMELSIYDAATGIRTHHLPDWTWADMHSLCGSLDRLGLKPPSAKELLAAYSKKAAARIGICA